MSLILKKEKEGGYGEGEVEKEEN